MLAWMLTALTAVACAASPTEAALAEGRAAQQAGRTEEAVAAYTRCLALDPQQVDCQWELGWSRWTLNDWDAVVAAWTAVQRLDPAYPELDRWLPKARDHAEQMRQIRAAAAAAPATTRPALAHGTTVRLRAVGDVMMGSDFPSPLLPPDDGAHELEAVAPFLRDADVTFANLEGPLCDTGTTKKCDHSEPESCYAFRTPTRYVRHLQDAGVDVVSTANNHSGDFDEVCRRQTEATLDRAGIAWSGPPGSIATVQAGDVRIGVVAFHTSASCNDVNDTETAKALVTLAASNHDLVVVSFHGGAEGAKAQHVPQGSERFYGENRGDLRAFARAVIAAGADLVVGHGPHVLRGMEVVDGHLVAYSMGNFATYGRFNLSGPNGLSAILDVTLDADGRFVSGRILPMQQTGRGVPGPDPEGRAIGLLRQLSEEDFGDRAPVIAADGTLAPR